MRTATITKIKGLSIQTQQNTFLLFTLFKLTLDERKTLTKISTCKTSHNRFPNQRTPRTTKKQGENPTLKGKQQVIQKKSCLHEQYTVLLAASAMATIQVVVPGQMVRLLTAAPFQQTETSTAVGHAKLIKFTKTQVLPNPNSTELAGADKNSATRVLTAAVFLKLERKYFDETTSHMDASTAFGCNVSQLSKAITGVDYKSRPHHYVPKKQRETAASKRKSGEPEPGLSPPKKQEHPTTPGLHTVTQPDRIISDLDTLSSGSSSSSELPEGL